MPRQRYEIIRQCLHFVDNNTAQPRGSPEHDRAFKVRPVFEHLNKTFQNVMVPEKYQSI